MTDFPGDRMRIGLFVTCLVDLFRPNVGFAAVKLLETAGCQVEVPEVQTCCGQPAYNNGDLKNARAIAKQVIDTFAAYPYVVVPSGSCAGMLIHHYPTLFADDAHWQAKAHDLAKRCYELVAFLADVLQVQALPARYSGRVVYHDSCSTLRELGIQEQPRSLLRMVKDLLLDELKETEVCCGFGGTFCIKYPEISQRMVSDKAADVKASGADTLVGCDLGCLLNIGGYLKRQDNPTKVYHIAELLAGMADVPAIGEAPALDTSKTKP